MLTGLAWPFFREGAVAHDPRSDAVMGLKGLPKPNCVNTLSLVDPAEVEPAGVG